MITNVMIVCKSYWYLMPLMLFFTPEAIKEKGANPSLLCITAIIFTESL